MESNSQSQYSGRYSTPRQNSQRPARQTPYSRPRQQLGAIGKQPILSVLDKNTSFSFMNNVLKNINGTKKIVYESIDHCALITVLSSDEIDRDLS